MMQPGSKVPTPPKELVRLGTNVNGPSGDVFATYQFNEPVGSAVLTSFTDLGISEQMPVVKIGDDILFREVLITSQPRNLTARIHYEATVNIDGPLRTAMENDAKEVTDIIAGFCATHDVKENVPQARPQNPPPPATGGNQGGQGVRQQGRDQGRPNQQGNHQ